MRGEVKQECRLTTELRESLRSSLFLGVCLFLAPGCATQSQRSTPQTVSPIEKKARALLAEAPSHVYTFFGVSLFEPFSTSGWRKAKSGKYISEDPTNVFPMRSITLNDEGRPIALFAMKKFSNKIEAQSFMSLVAEAIRTQYSEFYGVGQERDTYFIFFLPADETFIQSFKSRMESYYSGGWMATSVMPDDKLLILSLGLDENLSAVTLIVESRESHQRDEAAKSKAKNELISKTFSAYKPSEVRVEKGYSTGTGFFVSPDGYLLTNYHVIEGAKTISIVSRGGEVGLASIVKELKDVDLAILQAKPKKVTPLSVDLSGATPKGSEVMTLGYPMIAVQGQEQKATFGRINSLSGVGGKSGFFQVDVPIQPGNSGGPLINRNGRVVGVVTATLDAVASLKLMGAIPQNVNYAVKLHPHKDRLDSFLAPAISQHSSSPTKSFESIIAELQDGVVLVIAR